MSVFPIGQCPAKTWHPQPFLPGAMTARHYHQKMLAKKADKVLICFEEAPAKLLRRWQQHL